MISFFCSTLNLYNSHCRCPDSGPRATRMPTDDDYGRRDRLLLHQHPIAQYGSSSSPLPGSTTSNSGSVGTQIGSNSNECFKQQVQQQQSSDLRQVTNTACQSATERYQSDQQTQSSEHVGVRMADRHEKTADKSSINFTKCGDGRTSGCDRFGHYQAQSGEHAGSRVGGERHEKTADKSCMEFSKCGDGRQSNCERFGHYQAQSGSDQTHIGSRMAERHEKSSEKTTIEFTKCAMDSRQSNCERFGHYPAASYAQSSLQGHYGGGRVSADRFARFNDLSMLHGGEQRTNPSDRYSVCNSELRYDTATSGSNEYANANVLTGAFASETFPSPPSPAPANDRFVPPPPLSPTSSEKYASSQSLAGYSAADCVLPPNSPGPKYSAGGDTISGSSMPAKERFASAERLLANQQSTTGETKDQQRYVGPPDRLLSGSSPVLGGLQTGLQQAGLQGSAVYTKDTRFAAISADRILSSSPIHAPVPERFAGKPERYLAESPIHDRYPRQEPPASTHHERYSTLATATER